MLFLDDLLEKENTFKQQAELKHFQNSCCDVSHNRAIHKSQCSVNFTRCNVPTVVCTRLLVPLTEKGAAYTLAKTCGFTNCFSVCKMKKTTVIEVVVGFCQNHECGSAFIFV